MRNRRFTVAAALVGALLLAAGSVGANPPPLKRGNLVTTVAATVPPMINYQGRLTDAAGNPVPDGTYTMRFRIYDALTGGSLLWGPETQNVPVTGGLFSVLLGSVSPLSSSLFTRPTYLEVEVNGQVMSPRQPLATAPYAFVADTLQPGAVITDTVWNRAALKAVQASSYGIGLHGDSPYGIGIYGSAVYRYAGVEGQNSGSAPDAGPGVKGFSQNGDGVYGECGSTGCAGVHGVNNHGASGVLGESPSGCAVVGMSTDGTGVCATSTNNFGLNAYSANNTALRAFTGSSHPAIEGENTGSGPGVRGEGTSGYGGHFTSTYNDALYVDGTSKFTGQITSTVPTGTAPFSVASTTLNPNLNADMVDGLHAGDFALTVPLCCQAGEGTATTWTDIPMTTLYDQLAKFGHTKARLVATAAAGGSMGYIRLFNVTDGVEVASTGHGASGMYEIDISSAFTVSWDLKVFKLQYRCGGPGSWVRWREASFALLLYK